MIISDKSWHMRLNKWLDNTYHPTNLCRHFWVTVINLSLLPLVAIVLLLILLMFPLWWPIKKIVERPKRYKPTEPSLFREFLKAQKRRVCPLIVIREEMELPHARRKEQA